MKKGWFKPCFDENSIETKPTAPAKKRKPSTTKQIDKRSKSAQQNLQSAKSLSFKYEPQTVGDLVVHKKKIDEVEAWLNQHIARPRLACNSGDSESKYLLLSGPSGCGKSATFRVLAKSLNFKVKEWVTPLDRDFESYSQDNDGTVGYYRNAVDTFDSFLWQASRYVGLMSDSNSKIVVLVKDFPNAFTQAPEKFHHLLKKYNQLNSYPVTFVCNDDAIGRSLFPDIFCKECNIRVISFNPISCTAMMKVLKRILELKRSQDPIADLIVPNAQLLKEIVDCSGGDLRNAILKLHLNTTKPSSDENGSEKGKSGLSTSATSTTTSKDEMTDLFKLLGRILYSKRTPINRSSVCGQFSRGIHSLIGAVSPDSFDTLHSYSNTFQVPFITPWFPEKVLTPSSRLLDHALSMRPEYHQAVIDTINFYGWEKIIFIYETDDGLLRLQQMYQKMKPEEKSFKIDFVRKIRSAQDAISFLMDIESVDRWNNKYIVLDCSTQMAKDIVISHVRSVPLGKRTYHYLLSGLVMDDRWESEITEYGAINITGFRIVDVDRGIVKQFLKEWANFDIPANKTIIRQSISAQAALMHDAVYVLVEGFGKLLRKKPDIFRAVKKATSGISSLSATTSNGSVIDCNVNKGWITPWEHGDKISRFLRKVEIEGLTGDIRFNESGRRENYTLHIVEMTVKSAMVKIAEWSEKDGFKLLEVKYEKLPGPLVQTNKTYIVTTVLDEPYMMLRKAKSGEVLNGNDRYEGYCKDLADLISRTLNINYELVLVKDGKYGTENTLSKAGWDGMVGELMRNEADIAIAPLTITAERERVVDFTKPFASVGISIMMKKPSKQVPNVFSFLEPLSKEVWLCILFSFVAVSVVLFIVSRFSSSEWHLVTPQDQQYYRIYHNRCLESPSPRHLIHDTPTSLNPTILINDFSILNCFWFSIGTLLQQGCNLTPRSLSGRIVSCVWWLFALFLLASYTANLAAFFTIERMSTTVNSAEDLVSQTEVEYGTLRDSSIWNFFKKSQVPLYNKMWEFMNSKKNILVRNYEEGISKVRNSKGKYALLIDSLKNEYINQKQPCDTIKVGRNLHNEGYGIATPIGSPLKENINYAVLSLIEKGELAKIENRWWADQSECGYLDKQPQDMQSSLSLTHVAGVFYVLIGGLIFAMVIALIEFCYKSRANSSQSKNVFEQMSFHDAMKSKPKIMMDGKKYENFRRKEIMHPYYEPTSHLSQIDTNQILDNSHTQV